MKQRQLTQLLTAVSFGLLLASFGGPQVACQERSEGKDLLARNLKGWSRSGSGPTPWSLTTSGVLRCDAVRDSYTSDEDLGDGTLYVQWRFVPSADKKQVPTASLTLRSLDDKGLTIDLGGAEPGTLRMPIVASSDKVRMRTISADKNAAKKLGEWNSLKVVLQGKEAVVTINGEKLTSTTECPNAFGSLLFNVQGHAIEFRDVRWNEAK